MSDIFSAAERGDSDSLARLLKRGANPNEFRMDGVTALILAAINNRAEAIDVLLQHGADPNLPSKEGWYAYQFAHNSKQKEAAARLLAAHDGIEPTFDYAAHYLSKADPKQLAIYEALYSSETLTRKPFYNIGSGNWRHPHWANVDYVSDYYRYDKSVIDLPWDISLMQPIQVETDTAELAYCSHTCEHLTDEQNRHMFREMHRILNPGGVFRVTCPHAGLYYEAYKRRDIFINLQYGNDVPFSDDYPYKKSNMSVWLANEIATQTVQPACDEHKPMYRLDDPAPLDRLFEDLPMEAAFDHLCGLVDYDLHRVKPGWHINWWTPEKMNRELQAAGFSKTVVSVAGGSVSPCMRDRTYFDIVQPTFSLFVEAIK